MSFQQSNKKRQPSRAAKQRVRDAFDAEALKHLCTTWDFTQYAEKVDLPPARVWHGEGERERFYWYRDNGSKILAVAHLDTVQDDRTCQVTPTAAGLLATSGGLDDRLGVYVILDLLPKLGLTFDVLLTTDEEIGQSTADEFFTDKEYNWIIQFDRGGTDVVMYDYQTAELTELVKDAGATVGVGSFSDICRLDHLGVAGFNWGVGYRDYHSERSHAWLEDTFRMVARFVKFHKANKDERLIHEPYDYGYQFHGWTSQREVDEDYEKWWAEVNKIEADCGHKIDLDDEDSYIEFQEGREKLIYCAACCGV